MPFISHALDSFFTASNVRVDDLEGLPFRMLPLSATFYFAHISAVDLYPISQAGLIMSLASRDFSQLLDRKARYQR